MKHHLILKLYKPLADDESLPDWTEFINDKSVKSESINPDVDPLLRNLGVKFWVTKEYKSAGPQWNREEMLHGLNRTYRVILQEVYNLPDTLVQQIKLIPSVEDAHALEVGEARLPPQMVSTQ